MGQQANQAEQQLRSDPQLGWVAGLLVDQLNELPGGTGLWVGKVPRLAQGLVAFAEENQGLADVIPARAGGITRSPSMDWAPPRGPK